MNIETQGIILEMLSRQRNWLLFFLSFSFVLNFSLMIFVFKQKKTVVIVPTEISQSFEVSNKGVSKECLELISCNLLQSLNLTPESSEAMKERFLNRVHPSVYGEVKKQLDVLVEDVKKRQISTVFTPRELTVSTINPLTIEAIGYFSTYLGEKRTHQEIRRYRLRFLYKSGILSLIEFSEIDFSGRERGLDNE